MKLNLNLVDSSFGPSKLTLVFLLIQFTETDLIPGMAAFVACLVLPLEIGILTGMTINIIFILYHAARPKISIEFLSVSASNLDIFVEFQNLHFLFYFLPLE